MQNVRTKASAKMFILWPLFSIWQGIRWMWRNFAENVKRRQMRDVCLSEQLDFFVETVSKSEKTLVCRNCYKIHIVPLLCVATQKPCHKMVGMSQKGRNVRNVPFWCDKIIMQTLTKTWMTCILMTRPGGKHSTGFMNFPVLNGSQRRPLQDPAAHTK